MANKINDVNPPKKQKSGYNRNFVWHKNNSKSGHDSIFPFIAITVGIILLFNLFSLGKNLNITALNIATDAHKGLAALEIAKSKVEYNNFAEAATYFNQAEKSFNAILSNTWFLQGDIDLPINISKAGSLLSESGAELSLIADEFTNLPEKFVTANRDFLSTQSTTATNLTLPIAEGLIKLKSASNKMNEATQLLSNVNTGLMPAELKSKFNNGLTEIRFMQSNLERIQRYLEASLILLGHDVPSTILVPIQNNYELRATGGFPGSFALIEINKGIISNFEVHDIYEFDGQLVTSTEIVPPEFEGFTKEILARDSNYTPDFAISAARYEALLQKANGPSSDNVIAIDNSVIEELLKLTGPIQIDGYNGSITADNYAIVLNYLVEEAQGKDILKHFVSNFKNQLLQNPDFKQLISIIVKQSKSKHIQMFSKRPEVQQMFDELNISGSIVHKIPKNSDYLLVTNTSVGGNKSDRFIKQRIIHNTSFINPNTVQNTLTIRKFHSFTNKEEVNWQNYLAPFGISKLDPAIRHILGRGDNVDMVKVYVPKGSRLLSSTTPVSTELDEDLDLTYFLFKMSLKPGETTEATLTYKTKVDMKDGAANVYNLYLENPAGDDDVVFEKRYSQFENKGFFASFHLTGNNFQPYKYFPSNYKFDENQRYFYEVILNKPSKIGVIFDL